MTLFGLADLAVGDEVVEIGGGFRSSAGSVLTVATVGKRDLVLSNGHRYNIRTGNPPAGSYRSTSLVRADDPLVAQISATQAKAMARARLEDAVQALVRQGQHYDDIFLDSVQQALDTARAAHHQYEKVNS